ncbi:MAG: C45 family peptidase [Thermodesulfobacteriota bacterium]
MMNAAGPRPLKILELSGAPGELGRRHGLALAKEIRRVRRAFLSYLARISLYVGAWPIFGLLVFLNRVFWPNIPARLQEEMKGVAAGAGLDLAMVLLINVLDDLANNCPRCSALAVGGRSTRTGAWLMGRNLDYPLFTDILVDLQTLYVLDPNRGQPLASLAWPGYVGVCTGINQAGVGLSQLSAMSRDTTLKGRPAALRFRQALEQEHTLAGVAAAILQAPATIGNNVMLCGPEAAVVLEISARRTARRYPEAGLLTATNHYQSAAMGEVKGRFPRRPPLAVLSPYHFTEAYSQARDRRLRELAGGRKLGQQDLERILGDDQIANPGTVVSVVFAPAQNKLWVARGATPPVTQGPFQEIHLWS